MDYSKIVADEWTGTKIGVAYISAPEKITQEARVAYTMFVQEVRAQFAELQRRVIVHFQDDDPYENAEQMFEDVNDGVLRVFKTQPDQSHPLISPWDNNRFRAVHDYFGHYQSGRGFDRHGEEAAWVAHSQMFKGLARRALTTETRGQNSAFIWVNGGEEFPPQKGILLPTWMSEVPVQYVR